MVSTLQTDIIRAQNHKSSFDVKILEFGLNCFCETRKRWPFPHLTRQCKDKVFYLIEFFLRQILTTAYSFSQPQSKLLLGILDFQHTLYSLNLHESLMHWLKVHNYIFFVKDLKYWEQDIRFEHVTLTSTEPLDDKLIGKHNKAMRSIKKWFTM